MQVVAFPVELLGHLTEGLYLFIPDMPTADDPPTSALEAVAYLFTWTTWSTFSNPSRNSPYCSLYRYMVELASVVLHVFDSKTVEHFDAASRPFGRTQRKPFANFKLVGKTEQECDIHFDKTEPDPIGMAMDFSTRSHSQALLQPITSACCVFKVRAQQPV